MLKFTVAATIMLVLAGHAGAAGQCEKRDGTRKLQSFGTSYVVSEQPDNWALCIEHDACIWGTTEFPDQAVAGFGSYAMRGDGTCTTSFVSADNHPWTCDPPFETSQVAERLTEFLEIVPGECQAAPQQLWQVQSGGDVYSVLNLSQPVAADSFCVAIIIRMRDLEPFLAVSSACADASSAQQLVARIDPAVLQDSSSIVAVDSRGRGFARPFAAGATRIWGGLDETGTRSWLEAVNAASRSSIALATIPPAPLKPTGAYEARLAQWFAAAVARLDQGVSAPPSASVRSTQARDWMVANVLTRDPVLKDTLFRPEVLAP